MFWCEKREAAELPGFERTVVAADLTGQSTKLLWMQTRMGRRTRDSVKTHNKIPDKILDFLLIKTTRLN
jgi:hypothetical protein